ncbi:alpha/beta hydrolase family protein [Gordonia sp. ABSL1-1]|uniref:alpha/beta hydrolase n=1 Tax=Gordonia sp. ABSL1-1 TaxID=3053923 RepID=UPI002572B7B9|nr:alpha/beta hydrolase family protein [Gordonia sp. ABSL1-1]MDL9936857.1 alpha/beta hydrolase family protein [Gordonia sp. ABSL1-1]
MSEVLAARRRWRVAALVVAVSSLIAPGVIAVSPSAADVPTVRPLGGNVWEMVVHSAAMSRDIPLHVIRPRHDPAGAPTLYLLNGAGGGEDGANWLDQTDLAEFFADKHVNVVIPKRGIGSYYTDWIGRDPKIGRPRWQTFLTQELPAVVDTALNTNGRNAIAGLSMSATSVFNLAIAAPGLYRAVASYSGCARTSTPEGQAAVRAIVHTAAGANADHMWGPPGAVAWTANDPYLNAARLRGVALYISSGSGRAGVYDTPRHQAPGAPSVENQIVVGGALEAAARHCTEDMARRLSGLGIPAVVHLPATGTHSWRYWEDELHRSWSVLSTGLSR